LKMFRHQFDTYRVTRLNRQQTFHLSVVLLMVVFISVFHHLTRQEEIILHVIFRELYFLPIILAGFMFGVRGGLIAALGVSVLYVPLVVSKQGDFSGHDLGNLLEILLFNIVGIMVGWLRDRDLYRQELKRQQDGLANIGKTVSCIAHDMKTPLLAIGGFAHQIRRKLPEEDKAQKKLDIILKQTQRLELMVNDMLNYSTPLKLDCRQNCLNNLFRETLLIAEEKARVHKVHLSSQLQEEPPSCSFDFYRLQQALLNLINNAVEATPAEGTVIIRSGYDRESNCVIEVEDEGDGISADIIDKILQPFFSSKKEGTGLGLPIVKKITEAHDGILLYKQRVGKGMSFKIVLPEDTSNQPKTPGTAIDQASKQAPDRKREGK